MSTRKKILDQLFFGRDPLKDFPAHRHPTDLQGWHSQHPYLTRAIAEVKPTVVVEVGVWKGASVVTMAKEIQRQNFDTAVIAIDTWLGSSEHYLWEKFIPDLDFEFGYPRLYHKFAANICNEGLADIVVPLPLDSINGFQLLKEKGASVAAFTLYMVGEGIEKKVDDFAAEVAAQAAAAAAKK